jgi:nitric oxide reductase subunit C
VRHDVTRLTAKEKAVTKTSTRRFFFVGTVLFTALFIALTIHTHTTIASRTHADQLTDEVRRGGRVWAKYNCENCHTLLGEGAYYAPDLTQVAQQRGRAYLAQFLENPAQFYSEERDGRLMPTLGLSPQEISDVIAFLAWVGNIDTNGWPPRPILVSGVALRGLPGLPGVARADEPVSRGKALFNGVGACASCHSIEPGVLLVGPSLATVGRQAEERLRYPQYTGTAHTASEYLEESILKPSAFIVPGGVYASAAGVSFMPDTLGKTLTSEQVRDLVAYLMTLQ